MLSCRADSWIWPSSITELHELADALAQSDHGLRLGYKFFDNMS